MKKITSQSILISLALITTILTANLALAHEQDENCDTKIAHQGIFLGINAGLGGSIFDYQDGSKSISEDPKLGGLGGFRFGYAFSPKFALSMESYGFGRGDDEDPEWGIGAAMVAGTWHPRGGGFFLRGGFGIGGGEFFHPDTEEVIEITERAAFLFSIGYEWQLSDSFSLGLSADTMTLDAGGATGFTEDYVGCNGATIQFSWHL